MRRALLQALEDRYNAEISNADATAQMAMGPNFAIWTMACLLPWPVWKVVRNEVEDIMIRASVSRLERGS